MGVAGRRPGVVRMIRRFLFTRSRRGYGSRGGFDRNEVRNPERELLFFRRRLAIAGALVFIAFAGLCARFVYLQVARHSHYETLAESNRIAVVPIPPNRGVITDRNGVVLAQSDSAYTLEIQPSRVARTRADDRRAGANRRCKRARPQPVPQAPRRVEEFREPAAAHEAERRGSGAFRGQSLPLSRASRSRRGCSATIRSPRSARISSATSAASTIATSRRSPSGRRPRTTRAPTTSARSASSFPTSANCTAPPVWRRSRSMRGVAPCARCRARRRFRATTCACRSTSACSRRRRPRSAIVVARWSRSSPVPAKCWRSSANPASIRISSSTASTRRTGRS